MHKKKWIIWGVIICILLFYVYKTVEEHYNERMYKIELCNERYRYCLNIQDKYVCDYDGVKYNEGMIIDKSYLYSIIAGIRVFYTDYYDYYMVDDLIAEYELFCKTGDERVVLNDFYNAYNGAQYRMKVYDLTTYEVSRLIHNISVGKLYIEDNKVVRRDEATKKSSEVTPDMVIDACKYYEKYSEEFNLWYRNR